jgi:F-type H+-transporting ATPase subunit gamma
MANLKEIRNRISSVSSTMQITSAMKMVSAAKLKKAQDAITAMRPYSDKLTELLQNLGASMEGDSGSRFADQRPINKVLVVAISSNRGLAGAFNANIIKESKNIAENVYPTKEVHFLTLGKKANDVLKKGYTVIENNNAIFDDLSYENVETIATHVMELFTKGDYDRIELVYNSFKNAATQVVLREQFLPIVPLKEQVKEKTNTAEVDYIFEPSKEEIIKQLIPKALKTQFFKGIRDSVASEHGARMTAMHKATDNATELRDDLKLKYNKARQASITNEILEIVGGAEALKN